jgi:hypothetical protein
MSSASVNARRRRKHDDSSDLPKRKHVVRLRLPKKPDGDNVSPSSRDTKSRKDSRRCCARIGDD